MVSSRFRYKRTRIKAKIEPNFNSFITVLHSIQFHTQRRSLLDLLPLDLDLDLDLDLRLDSLALSRLSRDLLLSGFSSFFCLIDNFWPSTKSLFNNAVAFFKCIKLQNPSLAHSAISYCLQHANYEVNQKD